MRILHITDRMHSASGISQLLLTYSKYLHNDGIYFDYLVEGYDDATYEQVKKLDGRYFIMPKLGMTNIKSFLSFYDAFFKNHRYNIVHSHYYQIDALVIPKATRNGVLHYISHSHNPHYSDYFLRSIRNCILSFPIRFMATEFCACSKQSGDFLYGKIVLNIRGKSVFVLPNVIDYSKYYYNELIREKMREKLNITNEIVIGIVGSLRPQKNHEFLVKITKYIYDKYDKNIKLVIVGDGTQRSKIEKLIRDYNITNNIIITGATNNACDYYNAFDCYVLPSVYEGFGLSLLEAQVNSLRCVCSTEVPNDPIISNFVEKVSLSEEVQYWAKVIYNSAVNGRATTKFSDRFDVQIQSKGMTNFYINLLK